jgi:mono/diheme cytochrome c family protein
MHFGNLAAGAAVVLVFASAAVVAEGTPPGAGDQLRFVRDGQVVKVVSRSDLEAACGVETIDVDDPYYEKRMRYRACPLRAVLEMGFGDPVDGLAEDDFLLRALDGYVKPSTGKRMLEPGGWLALADADHKPDDGFAPIERRQVDPGPFYVVWSGPGQRDVHRYPWPYQLETIEIGTLAKEFPDIVPRGIETSSPAWAGYGIFKTECVACHSMNGQGGKIGPDLNVPRSIVEYRPLAQVKEFIRDPGTFRYSNMPSNLHLSDGQLDELIQYFEVMRMQKRDPGRSS